MDNRLWEKLNYDASEIHARNRDRAILMYSGGMDSTVALWWAMDHYENLSVIVVDYNQQHSYELQCAERILGCVDIPYEIIKLNLPKTFWGIQNHLTRGQAGLMTAIAAIDIGHEGADIIHGILRTDETYGDCKRTHLDNMAEILSHPQDVKPIGIATPLRTVKDKQAVAVMGYIYGAPLEWTWSCREPIDGKPCLNCAQCRQRNDIKNGLFENYGINYEDIKQWQAVLGSPYHPEVKKCPLEIYPIVRAFIEMGGMEKSKNAWLYHSPDGKERIATYIRKLDSQDTIYSEKGEIINCVEVHGFFENGERWQICVFDNDGIAITECLPGKDDVERAFRRKLVMETNCV